MIYLTSNKQHNLCVCVCVYVENRSICCPFQWYRVTIFLFYSENRRWLICVAENDRKLIVLCITSTGKFRFFQLYSHYLRHTKKKKRAQSQITTKTGKSLSFTCRVHSIQVEIREIFVRFSCSRQFSSRIQSDQFNLNNQGIIFAFRDPCRVTLID